MFSPTKSNFKPDPVPVAFRFANVFVYYGLSLNISDFGMNIYLTQMIFGLVEMPARTITLFTLNRSRKISHLAFLAVGGMACLLTTFVPAGEESLKCVCVKGTDDAPFHPFVFEFLAFQNSHI